MEREQTMTDNAAVVLDGLDAFWDSPSEYHAALDALVAERDELFEQGKRFVAERDEARCVRWCHLTEVQTENSAMVMVFDDHGNAIDHMDYRDIEQAHARAEAAEAERDEWKKDRDYVWEKGVELKERCEAAEAERDELARKPDAAMAVGWQLERRKWTRRAEAAEAERDEAQRLVNGYRQTDKTIARAKAAEARVTELEGLLCEWIRTGETSGGYTLRPRTKAALAAPTKEDTDE